MEVTENRLKELRQLKERLVRLRKEAVVRQKLLQDILPVVKSVSSGLLELSTWLDEADGILASHGISGDPEAVIGRINKHKVCFVLVLILLPRLFSSASVAGLLSEAALSKHNSSHFQTVLWLSRINSEKWQLKQLYVLFLCQEFIIFSPPDRRSIMFLGCPVLCSSGCPSIRSDIITTISRQRLE